VALIAYKKNVIVGVNELTQSHRNSVLKTNTENTEGCTNMKTNSWNVLTLKNVKVNKPIFIEGLPGLGNVGKVVADTLVGELKADKIVDIFSHTLPNSVFVNEKNLVELPKIELYHKKIGKQDFIFLTGDVQPMDEVSSYEFTEKILDLIQGYNCSEIITLGGIGVNEVEPMPKVFCTGNHSKFVSEFQKHKVNTKLYGIVGPIIGVSGLLLGLGEKRNIKAASLLAETYNHPMYIGLRGAKQILKVLMNKYGLDVSLKQLQKEIKDMDIEMGNDPKHATINQLKGVKDVNYIG
jgi:uncharacterized protein